MKVSQNEVHDAVIQINGLHHQEDVIKTICLGLNFGGHYIDIMRLECFQRCGN